MSNKTITQILFGGVLAIFLIYFAVLHVFFQNTNSYKNTLENLSASAQTEDWTSAAASLDEFKEFWSSVQYYVQFNNADQSYSNMNTDFIKLDASVRNKQKYETELYVDSIESLLDNFLKIAPRP